MSYEAQLRRFLKALQQDRAGELQWVEIRMKDCPLDGHSKLQISGRQSIGPAVRNLEQAVGRMLVPIEGVEGIKVLYREKRVRLVFEKIADGDGEDVVRYSDQVLDRKDRKAFETHLEETYGITVLSTETRLHDAA